MKINRRTAKPQKRTKMPIQVLLLAIFVLLGLVASQLMTMRAQSRLDKNKVDESYPIVDYHASLPADAEAPSKRERANTSYDRQRLVTQDPLGFGSFTDPAIQSV